MEARKIPSPNNSLTFFMEKKERVEDYETAMVKLEKQIEKSLIETFRKFNIHASVKTDRYSLPYTHEIKHTGYGESYLNGAFESMPLFRKVFKELLNENLYKIRFYIFAEIEDHFPMGKVNYHFRYYKH